MINIDISCIRPRISVWPGSVWLTGKEKTDVSLLCLISQWLLLFFVISLSAGAHAKIVWNISPSENTRNIRFGILQNSYLSNGSIKISITT